MGSHRVPRSFFYLRRGGSPGEGVAFIHGAEGIARRIVSLTEGQDFARSAPDFAVGTGELADFQRLAPAFARYGIDDLRAF